MKKNDILKKYRIDKLDESTVFISSKEFDFAYTIAKDIVKDEYKDRYRYFGGLQCNYHQDSEEFKNLENWLCEMAELVLGINRKRVYAGIA
jgi:hypothetical protein